MPLPDTFPIARTFARDSAPPLRWGIVAPGHIATGFVSAVQRFTNQKIIAVASRSPQRAQTFADRFELPFAAESYEALLARTDVDVIYVAAPQSEHLRLGLLAIAAGKHVLIEKPLAMSAAEGRQLVAAARAADVFLMEAMWTRYLPQSDVIRQLIADGVLGEIEVVIADHGQGITRDGSSRLWKPELGGGVLGDIAIYPIALSSEVLGTPIEVIASGALTPNGVDATVAIILRHDGGAHASITASFMTRTPIVATIAGDAARIDIAGPFFTPTTFSLADTAVYDGAVRTWRDETGVTRNGGLAWQATALAQFIEAGFHESPLHTHDEMVDILATIDEARRQVFERAAR